MNTSESLKLSPLFSRSSRLWHCDAASVPKLGFVVGHNKYLINAGPCPERDTVQKDGV